MILLLESLHPEAEALLAAEGALLRAAAPHEPPAELGRVRAILTRGRGRIDAALIARCEALEVIARVGAGVDNLDTQAARRRGIAVVYAPGLNASTVAEHTLALMLDLARGITKVARAVAAGDWEERARYQGDELRGRTLGIIGFGNIGRRVAALAEAFDMRVLVAAHPTRAQPLERFETRPLLELLAKSDVVSLHLPLAAATRAFLGPTEFAHMRPGALLVNTARGALIDMDELRAALASGRLGGFAADVLDREPPARDDPLLASANVLLTPHVASLTATTYRELCRFTAENVARLLRGEAPDPRSLLGP